MINSPKKPCGRLLVFIIIMMMTSTQNSIAQDMTTYMRIARITVDNKKLDNYKAALEEQIQSAIKLEKGVLAYTAVQDKQNPSRITIIENYASIEAYQTHLQTKHFKKYKVTVEGMVKELELSDVVPIAIHSKLN